ncbi:MAG: recombinase family protein [Candidatus Obscuribacterales bacterium]|nr:recombinase family protein [Candidatus Obscuribacterales bacterium]
MRLVGYSRVSTANQEDNTSLCSQREQLAAYCKLYGHILVDERQDIESANGRKTRKGLDKALASIYAGEADGLICCKLDRFARDVQQGLKIATDLRAAGKELVLIQEALDTSTPIGECIFAILLAFAQLERSTIRTRLEDGLSRVKAERGWSQGRTPYGYMITPNKQIVRNPDTYPVLKQVTEMRAEGISFGEIARQLNRSHIPPPRGKTWSGASIYCLIMRGKKLRGVAEGEVWAQAELPTVGAPQSLRAEPPRIPNKKRSNLTSVSTGGGSACSLRL